MALKESADLSLHLVTDQKLCRSGSLVNVVKAAVEGGATLVQLREKESSLPEFVNLALTLKALLSPLGIPLIINDQVEVALASGADGVHLGQQDCHPTKARQVLGANAIVGLSVENLAQAMTAEAFDVDYLGVSPVYPSSTKANLPIPWGPHGLRILRAKSRHALVGIGGINERNAYEVIRSGCDGVAVISAICGSSDPRAATRNIRREIERGKTDHEKL